MYSSLGVCRFNFPLYCAVMGSVLYNILTATSPMALTCSAVSVPKMSLAWAGGSFCISRHRRGKLLFTRLLITVMDDTKDLPLATTYLRVLGYVSYRVLVGENLCA